MANRPIGWRYESARHALAAKGIRTGYFAKSPVMGFAMNPMRPVDTDVPVKGWIAERKWDGTRIMAEVKNGKVTLMNRRGVVKNSVFPELAEIKKEVKGHTVLDGEVVVMKGGKEEFSKLAEREHLKDPGKIAVKRKEAAGREVVFDILKSNGQCLREVPLRERKRVLRRAVDGKGFVRHATVTTPEKARRQGAEGIVYKDPNSTYVQGRSSSWRKYKFRNEADVAVIGWEPGKGKRAGRVGALKIATWDGRTKSLRSIGKVGTGFTEETLGRLTRRVRGGRPFVVRVKYLKKGTRGALREPSFIAERNDIPVEATHV